MDQRLRWMNCGLGFAWLILAVNAAVTAFGVFPSSLGTIARVTVPIGVMLSAASVMMLSKMHNAPANDKPMLAAISRLVLGINAAVLIMSVAVPLVRHAR